MKSAVTNFWDAVIHGGGDRNRQKSPVIVQLSEITADGIQKV